MSKRETSKTKITYVRIPKDVLCVADALVEAGLFKSRTELLVDACKAHLGSIALYLAAYFKAKDRVGEPSRENIGDFTKIYVDTVFDAMYAILSDPKTSSSLLAWVDLLNSLEKRDPEKFASLSDVFEEYLLVLKEYLPATENNKIKDKGRKLSVPSNLETSTR